MSDVASSLPLDTALPITRLTSVQKHATYRGTYEASETHRGTERQRRCVLGVEQTLTTAKRRTASARTIPTTATIITIQQRGV